MHPSLILLFKKIGFYDTSEIFEIKRSAGTNSFEFLEVVTSPNILVPEALSWCFEVNVLGRRPVFNSITAVLEKNLPYGLGIKVSIQRNWSPKLPGTELPVALPTTKQMIEDIHAREQVFVDWCNDYRRQSLDRRHLYRAKPKGGVAGSGNGM